MPKILHKDLTGTDLHETKPHKASHQAGGSDIVDADTVDTKHASAFITHALVTAINDFLIASESGVVVKKTLAETLTILGKAAASGLASLDASSKVVQNPANATATPTANKIPIAPDSGKLDGWITTPIYSTDKLSALAATTSAELAGVISNEIGAGKLRFDTAVTVKTAAATLTVAEAGTILVSCAATPYTIILPTAVGNTGLTYHFIKTDANYNLITLDGDGTETLNFENSTGAPKETYARLNTYCAEVTVVSDGANWQCINEVLGQVPECFAYLGAIQRDLTHNVWLKVMLDTEMYDIGSNFNISTWVSGTATSTSAGHLVDTAGAFTSAMVGVRVKNTTDTTYTYITAYNSATDITIRDDIFVVDEGYEIKHSKFIVPFDGKYQVIVFESYISTDLVANKRYCGAVYKNGANFVLSISQHASVIDYLSWAGATVTPLSKNDYLELYAKSTSGNNLVDLSADTVGCSLAVKLISKD